MMLSLVMWRELEIHNDPELYDVIIGNVEGARDPNDPELYDVIIGNVEGARDPNDPELYDVIIGNVEGARDLMIQSCMMLSLVMWRELEI